MEHTAEFSSERPDITESEMAKSIVYSNNPLLYEGALCETS